MLVDYRKLETVIAETKLKAFQKIKDQVEKFVDEFVSKFYKNLDQQQMKPLEDTKKIIKYVILTWPLILDYCWTLILRKILHGNI